MFASCSSPMLSWKLALRTLQHYNSLLQCPIGIAWQCRWYVTKALCCPVPSMPLAQPWSMLECCCTTCLVSNAVIGIPAVYNSCFLASNGGPNDMPVLPAVCWLA